MATQSDPKTDAPFQPFALTEQSLAPESANPSSAKDAAKITLPTRGQAPPSTERATAQDVNPWSVSGEIVNGVAIAIDYDKLLNQFGTKRIDSAMLERFERVTGKKPHRFLRRGIVFSHRDLGVILDRYEKGLPFFIYTGRGPSSDSIHIGHTVPFEFTKCVLSTAFLLLQLSFLSSSFHPLIVPAWLTHLSLPWSLDGFKKPSTSLYA